MSERKDHGFVNKLIASTTLALGSISYGCGNPPHEDTLSKPSHTSTVSASEPWPQELYAHGQPYKFPNTAEKILATVETEFRPSHLIIPSFNLDASILEGRYDNETNILEVPNSGQVVDFTSALEINSDKRVLAGHSYWMGDKQPLGVTFDLELESRIELSNESVTQLYDVKEILVLDWEAAYMLITKETDTSTLITFTTLRNNDEIAPEKLSKQLALERSTNKDQAAIFFDQPKLLYWVIVAEAIKED